MNTAIDFSYVPDLISYSSEMAMWGFFIISYLTLPIYFYVHKMNRHQEKVREKIGYRYQTGISGKFRNL